MGCGVDVFGDGKIKKVEVFVWEKVSKYSFFWELLGMKEWNIFDINYN